MTTYKCFGCDKNRKRNQIAKSGTRKNGSRWHLCRTCSRAYAQEREMDAQAFAAAEGDAVRVGEAGSVAMGWNGVPSDRSLRGRKR